MPDSVTFHATHKWEEMGNQGDTISMLEHVVNPRRNKNLGT